MDEEKERQAEHEQKIREAAEQEKKELKILGKIVGGAFVVFLLYYNIPWGWVEIKIGAFRKWGEGLTFDVYVSVFVIAILYYIGRTLEKIEQHLDEIRAATTRMHYWMSERYDRSDPF